METLDAFDIYLWREISKYLPASTAVKYAGLGQNRFFFANKLGFRSFFLFF
jgi:hypothetical protein